MLDGVWRMSWLGNHPPAADDLVPRHLRLDQVVVDIGEGASGAELLPAAADFLADKIFAQGAPPSSSSMIAVSDATQH